MTPNEQMVAVQKRLEGFLRSVPEEVDRGCLAMGMTMDGLALGTRVFGIEFMRTAATRIFEKLEAELEAESRKPR